MGTMAIMRADGDLRVTWSRGVPEEVAQAQATFNDWRAKGYWAYRVEGAGRGSQVTVFDPDAEALILTPQMVGG